MPQPDRVADLIKKFGWIHNRLPALFVLLFRLRYLMLFHCFYYKPGFYTPEKPGCQNAFRVSTFS
jgi:hypothetical protein